MDNEQLRKEGAECERAEILKIVEEMANNTPISVLTQPTSGRAARALLELLSEAIRARSESEIKTDWRKLSDAQPTNSTDAALYLTLTGESDLRVSYWAAHKKEFYSAPKAEYWMPIAPPPVRSEK